MEQNLGDLAYVCPGCRAPLVVSAGHCGACYFPIELTEHGFLRVPGDSFLDQDHTLVVQALAAGNLRYYDKDERINRQFILKFSVLLVERLFDNRRDVRILSVGSGIGIDVEILRELGYQAWGTDCGSRCLVWPQRAQPEYLAQCADEHMPFADGFFDFVMCHQVLEHIGVVGDSIVVQPNSREIRQRFLDNLVRVTRLGGYINVATPNRTFPLDPGHAPNFFGVRVHGPLDRFLSSYGDMRSYFAKHDFEPLTPANYYAGTFASRAGRLGELFARYIRFLDRHPSLQGTFLNPLTNVLVHKVAGA